MYHPIDPNFQPDIQVETFRICKWQGIDLKTLLKMVDKKMWVTMKHVGQQKNRRVLTRKNGGKQ